MARVWARLTIGRSARTAGNPSLAYDINVQRVRRRRMRIISCVLAVRLLMSLMPSLSARRASRRATSCTTATTFSSSFQDPSSGPSSRLSPSSRTCACKLFLCELLFISHRYRNPAGLFPDGSTDPANPRGASDRRLRDTKIDLPCSVPPHVAPPHGALRLVHGAHRRRVVSLRVLRQGPLCALRGDRYARSHAPLPRAQVLGALHSWCCCYRD